VALAPQLPAPAPRIRPEHVAGVRMVLRQHGYDVNKSGPLTDRLLSAWKTYRANQSAPHKGSVVWNRSNPLGGGKPINPVTGSASEMVSPAKGKGGLGRSKRNFVGAITRPIPKLRGKGGGGGGGKNKDNSVNLNALQDIATKIGVIQPNSLADTLAGLQYDAPIHDARLALGNEQAQGAQDVHDIGHWYDQVMGAQHTAGERDHTASAGAMDSVKNAVTSIIQSLGGGANAGAAEVGAAGEDKVGLLAALGLNQDQYNNDLAPLLQAEGAGAKSRQLAVNSQAEQKAHAGLTDLLGQRGQAVAKNLLDVQQQNAQTQQQRFQNKLALEQANEAALMAGLNVIQANQKIAGNKAALKAAKGGWMSLDAPARENYVNHALQQAVTLHSSPDGKTTDWGAVANTAREILRRSYGYGSARRIGYKGRVPSHQAQVSINSFLNHAIQLARAKHA